MNANNATEIAKTVFLALGRGAVFLLEATRRLVGAAWAITRGPLIAALNIIAALLVLFEEWGWQPLSQWLARLAKYAPIAAFERWIAGLPPYVALIVIALPTMLLLPLKFVAVWLLANDHFTSAALLFLAAKVASTALIARIFVLTKPALMRIAWFARAYNWFIPWKDALFAEIRTSWVWRYGRMVKTRVKLDAGRAWTRMRPQVVEQWCRWTGREFPFSRKDAAAAIGHNDWQPFPPTEHPTGRGVPEPGSFSERQ